MDNPNSPIHDVELRLTVTVEGRSFERLGMLLMKAMRNGCIAHRIGNGSPESDPKRTEATDDLGMLIGARKIAHLLGISRSTVYALREQGKLPPPVKIGRAVRWRLADILKWVENDCMSAE